jgi:hypothetical protein
MVGSKQVATTRGQVREAMTVITLSFESLVLLLLTVSSLAQARGAYPYQIPILPTQVSSYQPRSRARFSHFHFHGVFSRATSFGRRRVIEPGKVVSVMPSLQYSTEDRARLGNGWKWEDRHSVFLATNNLSQC